MKLHYDAFVAPCSLMFYIGEWLTFKALDEKCKNGDLPHRPAAVAVVNNATFMAYTWELTLVIEGTVAMTRYWNAGALAGGILLGLDMRPTGLHACVMSAKSGPRAFAVRDLLCRAN